MTDMTPEQIAADAVKSIESVMAIGAFGAQKANQIHAIVAEAIRAALSCPADTEASRTLDALIALAAGDDGLPDDMRADVERLRARVAAAGVSRQLTTEQSEDGPVAWLAEGTRQDTGDVVHGPHYGDPDSAERYANIMRRAGLVGVSVQALYPASVKAERDALRERVKELVEIIGDIKRWDISNLLLDIPHPLRKRMQAVLAAMQEGKS